MKQLLKEWKGFLKADDKKKHNTLDAGERVENIYIPSRTGNWGLKAKDVKDAIRKYFEDNNEPRGKIVGVRKPTIVQQGGRDVGVSFDIQFRFPLQDLDVHPGDIEERKERMQINVVREDQGEMNPDELKEVARVFYESLKLYSSGAYGNTKPFHYKSSQNNFGSVDDVPKFVSSEDDDEPF